MKAKDLLKSYAKGNRDFTEARLEEANLIGANLNGAHLEGAHLEGAHLEEANLVGANLRGAYLEEANLVGANFKEADLTSTILDPMAACPQYSDEQYLAAGFELEGDFVIGWRTERSQVCGSTMYKPGKVYKAPWFSVDRSTECHPGLYFASLGWLKWEYPGVNRVRVAAIKGEIVNAGDKWRARRLMILPSED